jgi:hypothetical protein
MVFFGSKDLAVNPDRMLVFVITVSWLLVVSLPP